MMKKFKRIPDEKEDRLSTLPEEILLHILSFLNTKDAVQTSSISKTWRTLWTLVPHLDFDCAYFKNLPNFDKFVKRVLALRDNSTMINTFNFNRKGVTKPKLLEKSVKFAVSHGVHHLKMYLGSGGSGVPICVYLAESLRTFELKTGGGDFTEPIRPLRFDKLTSLHLECVSFVETDIFSGCPNLTELALVNCKCRLDAFRIYAPRLVRLTIVAMHWGFRCKVALLAPKLAYFYFKGRWPLALLTDELVLLHTLRVEVCPYVEWMGNSKNEKKEADEAKVMMNLLHRFCYAKYVTLSVTTIERLSVITGLIGQRPPLFRDLKSLKILASQSENKKKNKKSIESNIPVCVMNYLLGYYPNTQLVIEFVNS